MATLLTAAASALGRDIAERLGPSLRRTTREDCALGHGDGTAALVAGVGTVVHLEPALAAEDGTDEWVDACTRTTHNLLGAAAAAGVAHFVVVSRLDVLARLPSDIHPAVIRPEWRPVPTTAPASLGCHLAEFVARQWAFYPATTMRVTVLRVGDPSRAASSRFWSSSAAICEAVAAAVAPAEEVGGARYTVSHCGEQQESWAPPPSSVPAPPRPTTPPSSAVLLGANGMMGPPVAAALSDAGMELLLTDLDADSPLRDAAQRERDAEFGSDTAHQRDTFALPDGVAVRRASVDVADAAQVEGAVAGADVVVYCAVVREHPELAFRVNAQGTLNAIRAAAAAGHSRFVNSGPVRATVGGYDGTYHIAAAGIAEPSGATPPWPGVGLYQITKGLGAEICRIYSENFPISHLMCIFGGVDTPIVSAPSPGGVPAGASDMTTTLRDCGNILRCCVTADLGKMPSRHEVFFGKAPVPSDGYRYGKAAALLGYEPMDTLAHLYRRPRL